MHCPRRSLDLSQLLRRCSILHSLDDSGHFVQLDWTMGSRRNKVMPFISEEVFRWQASPKGVFLDGLQTAQSHVGVHGRQFSLFYRFGSHCLLSAHG
ncbi:hypothetical protein A1O7_07037 [Cladophialophora yegresii CBS 114405]|uniref:Uncharacterized protein n=1 Tax=Cladophialophora yegresii CBS 114405 TaxID=1182544 RepID=W9VMD8_9EURO|nr:uncharacterized protein A1O7_07037 [Cladophialophora yegresii CBS 114405]EXJ56693.1 hypothetical protein A1O7_07037 [Cladophialophora yegresii CBS 114405]